MVDSRADWELITCSIFWAEKASKIVFIVVQSWSFRSFYLTITGWFTCCGKTLFGLRYRVLMNASGNSWQAVCSTLQKQLFRLHVYTQALFHPVWVQTAIGPSWTEMHVSQSKFRYPANSLDPWQNMFTQKILCCKGYWIIDSLINDR